MSELPAQPASAGDFWTAMMKPTETAYLAAFPIAGTMAAYLFEFGFASYHGIPLSLVQLSVSQFVGSAVLGVFSLWVIHLYLSLGIAFLHRRKHLVFKFVGLGMLYGVLPFLLLLGLGNDTRLWTLFFIFLLLPTAIGFFGALLATDKSQSFMERWWEQSAFDLRRPDEPTDRLHVVIDAPQEWFSVLLLFIFLSFALGGRYASIATPSTVIKSDQNKALVVIYGERWFFRPLQEVNQPHGISRGELLVLSGDSVKDVVLIPTTKATK